jgi:hypothetical protein
MTDSTLPRTSRSNLFRFALLAILLGIVVNGCSCSEDPQLTPQEMAAKKKKEEEEATKKKAKKPFDQPELFLLPQYSNEKPKPTEKDKQATPLTPKDQSPLAITPLAGGQPQEEFEFDYVKPRHWQLARERRKANDEDIPGGELVGTLIDTSSNPTRLENVPYEFQVSRRVSLAKGQAKYPEYQIYTTPERSLLWNSQLRDGRSGSEYQQMSFPLTRLETQSYLLVILSPDATRFKNWRKLDTLRAPGPGGFENDYRIVIPALQKSEIPLPYQLLNWTTTAVVVWDNLDPSLFNEEQKTALIDWLYWGGVLVINGPTSMDKIKGSFLDTAEKNQYLPSDSFTSSEITPEQIDEVNSYWSIRSSNANGPAPGTVKLKMTRPWSGLTFKPNKDTVSIPNTGNLVLARNIGRGRVVVTAFNLKQKEFTDWPGIDSFVNAALLGRGPRVFANYNSFSQDLTSAGYTARNVARSNVVPRDEYDAYANTRLRILTRDWHDEGLPTGSLAADLRSGLSKNASANTDQIVDGQPPGSFQMRRDPFAGNPQTIDGFDANYTQDVASLDQRTAAGWSDDNPLAGAARTALGEASGIKIPEVGFVAMMLAVYLGVLVVANYGVFRALGRVEWAWAAAPVIAIAGSLAVIKLAQLDIGFARSQTEVAVLECYPNHPRAHLTRYTGLYSSLSSTYELSYSTSAAAAIPFPSQHDGKNKTLIGRVALSQDDQETKLAGFQVMSNSSSMIHSEQMLELGGPITYKPIGQSGAGIGNRTKFDLEDAVLFRKNGNGTLQWLWLGNIRHTSGGSDGVWKSSADGKLVELFSEHWKKYDVAAVSNLSPSQVAIPLKTMLTTLAADKSLHANEVRMIALIPKQLDGLTVSPAAAQSDRSMTIVVLHAQPISIWQHERDTNWRPPSTDNDNSRLEID